MSSPSTAMNSLKPLPEFVLLGDSLTEWSFSEETQGFGLFLEKLYAGVVRIVNEGQAGYCAHILISYVHKVLDELLICQFSYTSSDLKDDFDRIIARATNVDAAPTLLMTIFLGANDACKMGNSETVPWKTFEANIRAFVETILTQDAMTDTKIILITPPPISSWDARRHLSPDEIEATNERKKEGPGYKTYMSKKRYSEGIVNLAEEYEETGRVAVLNFWRDLVNAAIPESRGGSGDGGEQEKDNVEKEIEYNDSFLPGCGLIGARPFAEGWFTDGLHLDCKGYSLLSRTLMDLLTKKWPELAPDQMKRQF